MTFGKLTIDRVKNSKGTYDFGIWFNISNGRLFCINFGIAFIKSFHLVIYWN